MVPGVQAMASMAAGFTQLTLLALFNAFLCSS